MILKMITKILAISCLLAISQCRPEGGSDNEDIDDIISKIFGPQPSAVSTTPTVLSSELSSMIDEIFGPKPKTKREATKNKFDVASGGTCNIGEKKGKCIPYYKCKPSEDNGDHNCKEYTDYCCEESNTYSEKELEDMHQEWLKKQAERAAKKE